MISPTEAIKRLRTGNGRYATGVGQIAPASGHRPGLEKGQSPFAVVLACADSRVPVEMIFDRGPGDLFVTRVAGNIAAPVQIGSIEFAVTQLGARLIVVLGHSNCGAVSAALQDIAQRQEDMSPNLRAVIDCIRPALEELPGPTLHEAVIANVHESIERLRADSSIIAALVDSGEIAIVGAEYSIETGKITFLDD
jgi:carbonic anhydrase